MVLLQFLVVGMRYIFGIGSVFLQETVVYMHGTLFMVGAAYTLLHNGHVRVDILYREASPRRKAWVDLLGVLFFLMPVTILVWIVSEPYVSQSWAIREGSKETSGIQGIFLLKTMILVFATLLPLQGLALAARSILTLVGVEAPPPPDDSPADSV
jgi:TRAP-type mannitol/chloroaromatic compound transport system permease small subunit